MPVEGRGLTLEVLRKQGKSGDWGEPDNSGQDSATAEEARGRGTEQPVIVMKSAISGWSEGVASSSFGHGSTV